MGNMKKTGIFLFLVLVLVIFLTGCGGADKTALTTTATPEITSESPIKVAFVFPDGAPKLNNSSAFTCTITNNDPGERKMSVTIDAPETAFILESGSLSWSGTVPGNSEKTVIEAILKSNHTGHWQIDTNYHIDTEPDGFGGDFSVTIYVQMGMSSSEWGTTPPWEK
jgi:hypothetical protein